MKRLFLLLLFLPFVFAAHDGGHITLLAVPENQNTTGGTADLYLETRPGNGAIFIDSFPLTRLDTQGSVRYANQIACDFLQEDCARYDFFYTIRAGSQIVGGPSAGAAIAVLTVAVLDDQKVAEDIAMTGTINSGGIIGPVGGVAQKVEGAARAGIGSVLIPFLSMNESNSTNTTFPETVELIRVGTLEEAMMIATGKNYEREYPPVQEPEGYAERMTKIAAEICNRTQDLKIQLEYRDIMYNDSNNYTERIAAVPLGREYSKASLCFSSNIELSVLLMQNRSQEDLYEIFTDLQQETWEFERDVRARPISTLPDMEVIAIVQERLLDAERVLIDINQTDIDPGLLGYAQERLVSAKSWTEFFGMPGDEVQLDEEHLQRVCITKITEAEERVNYVRLYSDALVAASQETLEEAYTLSGREPIQCIFTASQAKAQANLVASALFIDEQQLDALLEEKLRAGELVLQKQAAKGQFPLLGYSYNRYAEDLADQQPYSALTFAEYALELSNLDLYFPQKRSYRLPRVSAELVILFCMGVLTGVLATLVSLRRRLRKPPRKKGP